MLIQYSIPGMFCDGCYFEIFCIKLMLCGEEFRMCCKNSAHQSLNKAEKLVEAETLASILHQERDRGSSVDFKVTQTINNGVPRCWTFLSGILLGGNVS